MHGLGEAVSSDFYVLRLILIELEVDRVSKDIVGEGPSESTDTSDCSVAPGSYPTVGERTGQIRLV